METAENSPMSHMEESISDQGKNGVDESGLKRRASDRGDQGSAKQRKSAKKTSYKRNNSVDEEDNVKNFKGMERYACENKASIDVYYDKKSKNNANNVYTVVNTITAFLNSGRGGVIELINKTESGNEEEYFERELEKEMKRLDQEKHYHIVGNYACEKRYLFIEVVSDLVASGLCAYKPSRTEVTDVSCTEKVKEIIRKKPRDIDSLREQFRSFKYGQVLKHNTEYERVQFKEVTRGKNEGTKLGYFVADKSSHAVSGFANYYGGLIIFGVIDKKRKVIGTKVAGDDKDDVIQKLHHRLLNMMLWCKIENGVLKRIEPQLDQHWEVEFIDIDGAPNGEQIIIVTVHGLRNGVVFTQTPKCFFPPDGSSDEPYRQIGRDEWCTRLQDYLVPKQGLSPGESPDGITKDMEQMKLHDRSRHILAFSFQSDGVDYAKKLVDRFFEASPGSYCKRSDVLLHTSTQEIIDFVASQCEDNERGVLIATNFGQCVREITMEEYSHPELLNDILLISDQKGVHLITCGQNSRACTDKDLIAYSKSVGSKIDNLLKGCMAETDISQFLLVQHITSYETFQQDLDFSEVPVPLPFQMDPSKMMSVLTSLAVLLAQFNSSFHQHLAAEYFNVLTEAQFDLLWPKPNDLLISRKRRFVHGLPGTGKTLIAMKVAKKLASKDGAESVLYICKNCPLSQFVRNKDICQAITSDTWDKFETSRSVKHIIIDEAQSFVEGPGLQRWFKKAEKVLKRNHVQDRGDETGFIWVFADMSQKYNNYPTGMPSFAEQQRYDIHILDQIVRNPVKVHKMALKHIKWYRATEPKRGSSFQRFYETRVIPQTKVTHNYKGEVEIVNKHRGVEKCALLNDIISEHTANNGKLEDIAILVSVEDEAHQLRNELREHLHINDISSAGPSSKYRSDFAKYPQVDRCLIVESVRRFSGMERAVVIIFCISVSAYDKSSNIDTLYFQGITRALSKVYIVYK